MVDIKCIVFFFPDDLIHHGNPNIMEDSTTRTGQCKEMANDHAKAYAVVKLALGTVHGEMRKNVGDNGDNCFLA